MSKSILLVRIELLNNAVESIQIAIEDYDVGTPARLRSCVRSIHAGILLLFKERLRRLSPPGSEEMLVKAEVKPHKQSNGQLAFIGSGRKTVSILQIESRFESLGVRVDWKRFEAITKVRNEIEHYYTAVTRESLLSLISNADVVPHDFVKAELREDPRKLLGDTVWQRMLEVDAVFKKERDECDVALARVKWGSGVLERGARLVNCLNCGSSLLRPKDASVDVSRMSFECSACGDTTEAARFVAAAVEEELAADAYIAAKDGDDEPYTTCPDCDEETYILGEEMRCALCGGQANHECSRCGCEIPGSELEGSLCGYCNHIMSKDD